MVVMGPIQDNRSMEQMLTWHGEAGNRERMGAPSLPQFPFAVYMS